MIRRLDRHVLGRFLPALGLITLVALFLFSLVDFMTRAAAFIREGFPTFRVLQFYLYLAPELFTLLAPLVWQPWIGANHALPLLDAQAYQQRAQVWWWAGMLLAAWAVG
jgi:hypothetical protein